jgi:hypothetical protein
METNQTRSYIIIYIYMYLTRVVHEFNCGQILPKKKLWSNINGHQYKLLLTKKKKQMTVHFLN